jgi:hypothetical protein
MMQAREIETVTARRGLSATIANELRDPRGKRSTVQINSGNTILTQFIIIKVNGATYFSHGKRQ